MPFRWISRCMWPDWGLLEAVETSARELNSPMKMRYRSRSMLATG